MLSKILEFISFLDKVAQQTSLALFWIDLSIFILSNGSKCVFLERYSFVVPQAVPLYSSYNRRYEQISNETSLNDLCIKLT